MSTQDEKRHKKRKKHKSDRECSDECTVSPSRKRSKDKSFSDVSNNLKAKDHLVKPSVPFNQFETELANLGKNLRDSTSLKTTLNELRRLAENIRVNDIQPKYVFSLLGVIKRFSAASVRCKSIRVLGTLLKQEVNHAPLLHKFNAGPFLKNLSNNGQNKKRKTGNRILKADVLKSSRLDAAAVNFELLRLYKLLSRNETLLSEMINPPHLFHKEVMDIMVEGSKNAQHVQKCLKTLTNFAKHESVYETEGFVNALYLALDDQREDRSSQMVGMAMILNVAKYLVKQNRMNELKQLGIKFTSVIERNEDDSSERMIGYTAQIRSICCL